MALDHIDLMEKNLARQTEAIRAADLKIALLVPTTSAMVGVLAALFRLAEKDWVNAVIFLVCLLPLATVFVLMALSVVPRFRPAKPSLLFFGGIDSHPPESFERAINDLDHDDYLTDLIHQCHTTAGIARTKHRLVRRAYAAFLVALPLWTTSIFMLTTGAGH